MKENRSDSTKRRRRDIAPIIRRRPTGHRRGKAAEFLRRETLRYGLQAPLGERARIYPCQKVREEFFSFGLQALPGASAAQAGERGIVMRRCGTTKVVPFHRA